MNDLYRVLELIRNRLKIEDMPEISKQISLIDLADSMESKNYIDVLQKLIDYYNLQSVIDYQKLNGWKQKLSAMDTEKQEQIMEQKIPKEIFRWGERV